MLTSVARFLRLSGTKLWHMTKFEGTRHNLVARDIIYYVRTLYGPWINYILIYGSSEVLP